MHCRYVLNSWLKQVPGPLTYLCDVNILQREKFNSSWSLVTRRMHKVNELCVELGAAPKNVYIETNPNFKMWFWDIVLDLFVRNKFVGCSLDVLVVRRYIPALVKSLYELGWFTKKDGYGKRRIQYSALEPFCRKLHI